MRMAEKKSNHFCYNKHDFGEPEVCADDAVCFEMHFALDFGKQNIYRGVSSYLKLGGQLVMQRSRRCLLFFQKLDGNCPPCSPSSYAPEHIAKLEIVHTKFDKYVHIHFHFFLSYY